MLNKIVSTFRDLTICEWKPTTEQIRKLEELLNFATQNGYSVEKDIIASFIEAVNQKLSLNANA